MKKKENKVAQRMGKRGRRLMTFGLCSNCLLLICTSIFSSYENRLDIKNHQLERYIKNLEAVEINNREVSLLEPIENILILISKIAYKAGTVHPVDIRTLKENKQILSDKIEEKINLSAKITCFLNEYYDKGGVPPENEINKKIGIKSKDERVKYIITHGKSIRERVTNISLEALHLSNMKDLFRYLQSFFAVLSALLILLGTIFLYKYEDRNK